MCKKKSAVDIIKDNLDKLYGHNRKTCRTLFYDESNNIRVARLTSAGTNNPIEHMYFILGGIAVTNEPSFDLSLVNSIIPECEQLGEKKFKYFTKNKTDFKDILKSDRLLLYFNFLIRNNINIHFNAFHYFYWSIIDIFDSLFMEESHIEIYLQYHLELKSDFIEVLYKSYDEFVELLYKFNYPKIEMGKNNEFINEICDLYQSNYYKFYNSESYECFSKEFLRQMIKGKKKATSLSYIDGDSLTICKDIHLAYIQSMCILQDKKLFDEEPTVEKQIYEVDHHYKTKTNSDFVNSKDEIGIQLSDCLCGFVSKLLNFISANEEQVLSNYINSLKKDAISIKILKAFYSLYKTSSDFCEFFISRTIPQYIEIKFENFFELVNNK